MEKDLKQIIIDGVDVSGCEKQGETIAGITCGNGERIRLANEIITKHKLCKDNPVDIERYKNYNCFQTCDQALFESEKILIRRQLEEIARMLNKGEEIDFTNRW